jgi:hypothetical protein
LDWTRRLTLGCALALPLVAPTTAVACPLCYGAAKQLLTEGVQLDNADRAVLAVRDSAGVPLRIVAIIKGSDAVGDVVSEPVTETGEPTTGSGEPLLLVHDPSAPQWTGLGTIPLADAEWLRQVAATRQIGGERPRRTSLTIMSTAEALSYAGWRTRIALLLPRLEDKNPFVARLAWSELARAPYAALDVARSRVDAAVVQRWLSDPKLASRRATYLTLLGFVGRAQDAKRLNERVEAALASHDATDLAALIGADLEVSGPSRVDWLEEGFFADRTRTMPEIEAALLALKVLGDANATIPRTRVIQAYRDFIRLRPAMAGFVAPQLADWSAWDAAPDFSAVVRAKAVSDPASQFAIADYLNRAAKAGVAAQ